MRPHGSSTATPSSRHGRRASQSPVRKPHSPTHKHSNNKHSQNYSSSVSSSQTSSNPPSQSALHPHHTRPYPHPQKPSLHHASKPQARTGAVSATITSPPDSLQKCVFSALPSFLSSQLTWGITHAHEQTTPQRQLPFSASTTGGGGPTGSASDPRGLAQSYSLAFTNFLASPTSPSQSSPSAPHDRSFGSLPPSPSPISPLAAYRGRRAPTGRASFFLLSDFFVLFFFLELRC